MMRCIEKVLGLIEKDALCLLTNFTNIKFMRGLFSLLVFVFLSYESTIGI